MKRERILMLTALLLSGAAVSGKDGRTYYDTEMMAKVKATIAQHDWAKAQVAAARSAAAWYLDRSDQELWDFVPPAEQLRAINVCIAHDCPFCGDEITRKAGHYPWRMDRDKPFKLECPVCKRVFPENDFEPWNTEGLEGKPESGETIIDKGLGWIGPDKRRYYFVPYYIFWQRWVRDIIHGMAALSRAYLLTAEPAYARKCAVIMARVASQYERFDYRVQCYHEGRFNVTGRISDHIWTTGDDSRITLAYDGVHPIFKQDAELLQFLREKGIANPMRTIEDGMLKLMADDVMGGKTAAGNMGAHQKTLAYLAIVLNNDDPAKGVTTEQMRDWIMRGPGRVEDLLWNGFWRDGLGGESSPSYSSGWCTSFYTLAEVLPRIGVDIWGNPKLKKMADIGIDMTVAGAFCPNPGDSGGLNASGPVALSASLQGPAFMHYRDPRHAKALKRMNAKSRDVFQDDFDEADVEKVVAEHGTDMGWRTRSIGGFGLAILESGTGDHRRAVSMYYGYAGGGHGHRDRLNIQMWAHGHAVLPEDGYPFPFTRPDFYNWRGFGTVKHYCVVVDERTQTTLHAGHLNTLAACAEMQLMDGSAEVAYEGLVSLYRRTAALIDISDLDSYLLDIFRVRGGKQHDWCFHGPPFPEFAVTGGQLGPVQAKGTLAGEDIAFGAKSDAVKCGFHGLFNVRRLRPEGMWSATWRKPDHDLGLTMTMPAGCAGEVITADAQPELQPGNPDIIQYVLGRNIAPADAAAANGGLLSKYVAVVEPHRGTAAVTAVELLHSDRAPAEAVGVIVRRQGAVDLIHSSPLSGEPCEWQTPDGTFTVVAEFAMLTLDERGIRRAVVVNGTLLRYGAFSLHPAPALQGSVIAVDHAHNTIAVDQALPLPDAVRAQVIIVGNELHSTNYTIREARVSQGRTLVDLGDVLCLVGMGEVAATDRAAGSVTSDRNLAGYGRTDGGRHAGRWLYNESRTEGFRIASVSGKTIQVEGLDGDPDAVFSDADGDGRRQYWISDIGPGDTFRIPTTTSYARQ